MEKQKIMYNRILIAVLACLIVMFAAMSSVCISPAFADAPEITYTNVMDDLTKSADFTMSDYPDNADDHTLYVEQIAESNQGELFVYVYNPCAKTTPYIAKDISMSNAASVHDLSARWAMYDLTLLSSEGVFSKYLVNDFKVKDDIVRYYDISEIHRSFNADIDDDMDGGDVNYTACRVAKRYTAMTTATGVHYACVETTVIEVTAQYAGFTNVKAGGLGSNYDCHAHFVAFSTDMQMDKLMEADITYYTQDYSYSSTYQFDFWKVITGRGEEQTTVHEWHGEPVKVIDTIAAGDTGTFKGDGWFCLTYTWDRIQTVDEFKSSANPDSSMINSIDGMQWVLRFAETKYSNTFYSSSTGTNAGQSSWGTKVYEVTILRLMFETAGDVYNLGVVMDIVTADDIPDGTIGGGFDFFGSSNSALERFVKILLITLACVLLLLLLSPILPYIFKGIAWIITAPFKAIAACVKSAKNNKKGR